jgi:hypothetical protein
MTHESLQVPEAQRWPVGQTWSQVPQFCESLSVSAQ